MNKKQLSKKNNLIIVGSARGVKKFYIVNKCMQNLPDAKVIHTGNLLQKIIKNMELGSMDSISIYKYYKYVEPVFLEVILSHLEHSNVILDTHYYYLLPGLSIKEILKFKNKIGKTLLVLVNEDKEEIKNNNGEEWFKNIKNIEEDILLNKYSFENYKQVFNEFSTMKSLEINLKEEVDEKLIKIIGEIKNGTK
tara:strand:- start:4 stop:585 length:582 start_codon:yes stop_codon:yes gene_type:complete